MHVRVKRRRKESLTNYKKRVALLKSGLLRLVVRRSNRGIMAQITEYELKGDRVLASARSKELKAFGWEPRSNIPTAYLTGLLLAKKVREKEGNLANSGFILDIGLYRPIKGSTIFAAAKGFKDSGMGMHGNIEIDEERLSGKHISAYANESGDDVQKRFAGYIKAKFDVKKLDEKFAEVKKQLSGK